MIRKLIKILLIVLISISLLSGIISIIFEFLPDTGNILTPRYEITLKTTSTEIPLFSYNHDTNIKTHATQEIISTPGKNQIIDIYLPNKKELTIKLETWAVIGFSGPIEDITEQTTFTINNKNLKNSYPVIYQLTAQENTTKTVDLKIEFQGNIFKRKLEIQWLPPEKFTQKYQELNSSI